MRIYLVEITAVTDYLGTTQVFRFSSKGYTTEPTDTPPNASYIERLKQPSLVRRDMFGPSRTFGQSQVGVGELILSNADGGLDFMRNYGFDGQPLVLKVGEIDAAFSTFETVLTATVEQVELTELEFKLRVRDRQAELAQPLQTERYAGTGGVEGTGLDVQGRVKPLVYGQVFNVTPVIVNGTLHIYQVADNAIDDIQFAYDRGVAFTRTTPDYTDLAHLLDPAHAPAAGHYRVFEGYFRLHQLPSGVVTADVVEGATAADRTVAQILKRMALKSGIDAGEIVAADVTALDALNNSEIGIYIDNEGNANNYMDEVAASIGAYYGFDATGQFRMGRLQAPALTTMIPVIDRDLISNGELQRIVSRDPGRGVPAYRVTLQYAKNYTLQDRNLLANSVTGERGAELALQYRTVLAEDVAILNKHSLAPELPITTLLVDEVDAQDEADRLLDLYSAEREVYEIQVWLDDTILGQIDIGKTVTLMYSRFGLDTGKNFVVIGFQPDYQLEKANLTLWG